MLVLGRKLGESFTVGNATITVVETRRGKVRLGIEAPPDVLILRSELVQEAIRNGVPISAIRDGLDEHENRTRCA